MCAPCLALVPRAGGDCGPGSWNCLYEDKAILENVPLPPHSNFKLTLNFLYLHLPGYALSFKIFKVSLKFHPFLKQDKIAVSREV